MKLLDLTGRRGDCFDAAYFSRDNEYQMTIQVRGNEWLKCLKDTAHVATYAVIADICFQGPTRDNDIRPCYGIHSETMLETQISVSDELPSKDDTIKLSSVREVFRVDKIWLKENRITLIPTGQLAGLAAKALHRVTATATEVME